MEFTNLILLLSVVGMAFGLSGSKTGAQRPNSWFNFWEMPVVGNSQSSGGPWTPGPQAGGGGQPAQGAQGGQAAGQAAGQVASQNTASRSRPGVFNWFQSVLDPQPGAGSSTIPPNVDAWANPDAAGGMVRNRYQGGQRLQEGEGHFGPGGGFYPGTENTVYNHNPSSGEHHPASGPMARPGGRHPGMAAGGGQTGYDTNMAGGIGGSGGRGGGRRNFGPGQPIPNLPYNAGDMQTGQSASAGATAGTLVGVALAVVVVVGVFAGAAYVLTRQRRNNHVVMANV